jgi:hypothetical protein
MAKQNTSVSFTKETAPKTGRKLGTKNKSTQEMRDMIQMVTDKNIERLAEDLDLMSPTNRWMVLPKLAATLRQQLQRMITRM